MDPNLPPSCTRSRSKGSCCFIPLASPSCRARPTAAVTPAECGFHTALQGWQEGSAFLQKEAFLGGEVCTASSASTDKPRGHRSWARGRGVGEEVRAEVPGLLQPQSSVWASFQWSTGGHIRGWCGKGLRPREAALPRPCKGGCLGCRALAFRGPWWEWGGPWLWLCGGGSLFSDLLIENHKSSPFPYWELNPGPLHV